LLLVGEHDTMRVDDIRRMGELIPRSRVAIIPSGSHCSMWDAQEPYFEALIQFVREVEGDAL
jgi:proline iminopeptidase